MLLNLQRLDIQSQLKARSSRPLLSSVSSENPALFCSFLLGFDSVTLSPHVPPVRLKLDVMHTHFQKAEQFFCSKKAWICTFSNRFWKLLYAQQSNQAQKPGINDITDKKFFLTLLMEVSRQIGIKFYIICKRLNALLNFQLRKRKLILREAETEGC